MPTTRRRVKTQVLSSFGVALAAMAGNLAMAADAPTVPKNQLTTQPALATKTLSRNAPTLEARCRLHDESCLMGKDYVKTLNDGQRKQLKVLIGLGVQTDIKDACLVC